jgi:hypothetical protein
VCSARRRHDISLKSLVRRAVAVSAERRRSGFSKPRPLLWALLILAVIGPATAAADGLDDALRGSALDPAERAEVRRLFDEASSAGLPQHMLVPRLEEGLAKRVPVARILRALELEMGYLVQAREVLSAADEALLRDEGSWARTANLLAGGLTTREVSAVVRILRPRRRDFRPATYLYAALVEWGLPREQALALLEALVASDLPGEEFPGVVELLALGRRVRIPPEVMVDRIRDSIGRVHSLDELQRLVLY